ncbi:tetratricopeptide repeat protein [Caballeronia insecticola]|uniref:protein O-GlcNAc transferase n=1 Tax=Caballeronia insecticola TaxID=758793 RepID=R4WVD9_9BURK|nr:tetratricopeptide repeat protein [Caballeronia insecticola]BAN21862.1 tetratricopeptide TPR_2 repeat protein [Caballeronia insecticola]
MTTSIELNSAPSAASEPDFEDALAEVLGAAIEQHGAQQLDEAEALYGIVLDAAPAHAIANYNLGVLRMQRGDPQSAIARLEAAIGAQPDEGQYWASYVDALAQSGQSAAAWLALEMAQKQGLRGPAIDTLIVRLTAIEAAKAEAPQGAQTATLHESATQPMTVPAPAEVATSATTATNASAASKPSRQQISQLTTYFNQARVEEALALAHSMTIEYPNYFLGWKVLGILLHQSGKTVEAIGALQTAKQFEPGEMEIRRVLSDSLRLQGRAQEAEQECREILAARPDYAEVHRILGMTLQDLGRLEEALAALQKAVELTPDFANGHSTLAIALLEAGRIAEAEQHGRRALALNPRAPHVHEALLFCLTHKDDVDPAAVFADHAYFGEMCEAPLRASWPRHRNNRDPERRLNVGFVSGDFIRHPVTAFVEAVITHLTRDPSIIVHAYSNHTIEDEVTARMQRAVPNWHSVAGMSDELLARKIQDDGIDILIDLSGHTARNRLMTFARKPAPIQASWMGYLNTTGLQAMDYYIADRYYVPNEAAARQFTEKIAYLPAYACFQPELLAPPVNALPALHNGYVTFGSFNRVNKVRPAAIKLWSKLLHAVPTARMQLAAMPNDGKHEQIAEWFASEGIERARLDFRPRAALPVYLQQHHQVDINLDTFPWAGGVTTFQSMWMGVPTLTLPGPLVASRGSMSALSHAGLDAFVANDEADFVAKGVYWANHPNELAQLRAGMRERCALSPSFNADVISAGLAASLRTMWRRWCAGETPRTVELPAVAH